MNLPIVLARRYRATNERHATEYARICRAKQRLEWENARLVSENLVLGRLLDQQGQVAA
jgi:hypothetical protein